MEMAISRKGQDYGIDLLEELLELGGSLSVAKIKKMIDKIAHHVPGYFLSLLGMHALSAFEFR